MKLVTFSTTSRLRPGLLTDTGILDLEEAFAWFEQEQGGRITRDALEERYGAGVLGFIEHEQACRAALTHVLAALDSGRAPKGLLHDAGKVTLHSPIPRPPSMRDGYAFRQHVETARRNRGLDMIPEFDQFPVFYFTNHQAVVGPGPVHVREQHLDRLDFELEAAIVVGAGGGKPARDLSASTADAHIFGLMIMNDFSARALQMEEMKLSLGPAKGKDFATGLGPYLVTLDELAPKSQKTPNGLSFDLGMRAFVNDVQVSTGNVKDMNWTFAQIMARASYGVTLYPGDVIGSGTCGTGCFLELNGSKITDNQWLKPGDRVALEIDGLGRLDNVIVRTEP
jgi:fumarylacetoacetate (FAA) hydrolase